MKFVVPVLLLVAAVAVAGSLAWFFLASGHRGGVDVGREERALPPFSRVAVEGFADVVLVHGAAEAATVEAAAKHVPRVRTDVADGTLTIAGDPTRRWWSGFLGSGGRPARITIVYRSLDGISASGAVKIRAEGLKADRLRLAASGATSLHLTGLDVRELALAGSGATKAELAGRAGTQRVTISGAGDFRGAELAGEDARVTVSGAGRVVVNVAKTLDIGISGAGSVEYLGHPKVTERVTGAGRVKRRDAADGRTPIAVASAAH